MKIKEFRVTLPMTVDEYQVKIQNRKTMMTVNEYQVKIQMHKQNTNTMMVVDENKYKNV